MAEFAERFGVVCLRCGSWRVHISVKAFREADGEMAAAPVLTCIVCHAQQVYDEQQQKTVIV